ncbi:MAG: ParB/RepB/Spo0J family partition protein [Cyanobacteria bacterium P01_F01_bin.116]
MAQPSTKKSSRTRKRTSKSTVKKEVESKEVGRFISVKDITRRESQPRRYFNEAKLEQLAESIQKHGVLEPLIVRPLDDGTYEIVAGERRYRAAQAAGLTEVPIVIRELDEQQAFELALLENLQRDDLNPIDETEGMLELLCQTLGLDREGVISLLNQAANAKRRDQKLTDSVKGQLDKADEIFQTVGRQGRESFRTNRLPLLNLPDDVLEVLRGGELEYTKAKAIARVDNSDDRKELMEQAIKERWSLSEVKQRIKELLQGIQSSEQTSKNLQDEFRSVLKVKSSAWTDNDKRQKIESLLDELKKVLNV